MKIKRLKPFNKATASELAAHFKSRSLDRYQAWDAFIIARGLRPEMNAKEFYAIYDAVAPTPLVEIVDVDFQPTHFDTLLGVTCQIEVDERGVRHIIWEHGACGSDPPAMDGGRYVKLKGEG